MNDVQTFYSQNFGDLPPFPAAFLDNLNLNVLQTLMTMQLRESTGNPVIPTLPWTEAHLEALVSFAYRYRTSEATEQLLTYANWVFVDQMASQNETHYLESCTWQRWCAQGIPDPNNMPLPLSSERTDYTVDTSDYILSDSIGYRTLPTC